MSRGKLADRSILTIAVLGSFVFLNLVGLRVFGRLDLTRDRQFTLSSATVSTLKSLEDPLTVRAYFTRDLPPPFSANTRYVRDLLEEYYAHAGGNLRYEFVDPLAAETDADKEKKKEVKQDIFGRAVREQTSVERDLDRLGISPVQVQANEGDKLEVKRAYMGIALSYGGRQEAIPVVQDTAGLEYNLTTLIRKLVRTKRPKVALITGHDGPDPQREIGQLLGLLRQLYDLTMLDLAASPEIPKDVDALIVVAPRKPLAENELRAVDAFITGGGSAAFLLDDMKADLETLKTEDVDHGLAPLLAGYGVDIERGLVLDAECATLRVSRQQGFLRIQEPVQYPFMPQPRSLEVSQPLTRGLTQVVFPFMSPLRITASEGGPVRAEVLVRSSPQSWVLTPPYDINPFHRWTRDAIGEQASRNLVVALTGALPGRFAQGTEDVMSQESRESRVIVAGGSSFLNDQFLARGNKSLVLNLIDWLVRDDALLAIRTRGLQAAPLEEVRDSTRASIKYANIVGVPLLCAVLGLVRWRYRERRRCRVSV
jgi:gliding-associated putative ABC transporter substrate-binding component GldG